MKMDREGIMKNRTARMVVGAITSILVACGGGGSSPSPAEVFVSKLNSQDYKHIYQLVKSATARGGSWIIVSQSEYYQDCYYDVNNVQQCTTVPTFTDNYAINLDDPTRSGYGNDNAFFLGTGLGVGYNKSTGYYFDQYGNQYSKQGGVIKDLNVLGAKAEEVKRAIYATEIQNRFGLSSERSFAMAKMGMNLQALAARNGGKIPAKDQVAFEKFAFGGLDMKTIQSHIQTGDTAAFARDKEVIANANGITVEDVSYLISKMK